MSQIYKIPPSIIFLLNQWANRAVTGHRNKWGGSLLRKQLLTLKDFITPGLWMMISSIIDSVDIGIRIILYNPISVELQYQHTTFTTHITSYWIKYAAYLTTACSCFSTSCSQSPPLFSISLLYPLFPSHVLGTTITPSPSPPTVCVCFFILSLFSFHSASATCSNALMLLIFVCQSSHPVEKLHLCNWSYSSWQLTWTDTHTTTHTNPNI